MFINDFIAWLDYPPWVWVIVALYFSIPFLFYIVLPRLYESRYYARDAANESLRKKQVLIVVLGDLGHSPRMLYHAKSFLEHGYKVQLFGYVKSSLPDFIVDGVESGHVYINEIRNLNTGGGDGGGPGSKAARLVKKVVLQHWYLGKLFVNQHVQNSRFVVLQNPPILPILHILLLWKALYSPATKTIVDWHNLNYSILQLKFDAPAGVVSKKQQAAHKLGLLLVRIMKWYEFNLSKASDYNLTVSQNMKTFLTLAIYANVTDPVQLSLIDRKFIVLHDRPASQFKVLQPKERQELVQSNEFSSIFQTPELKDFDFAPGKDKILLSSTSFTKDEDFNILLDALKKYDALTEKPSWKSSATVLPKILLVVTGKGPEQAQFHTRVQQLQFSRNVAVTNRWFSAQQYPRVVAAADLAVSLHLSSSGLDLPMKILDFFGCGVPTVSVRFDTIGELVKDGVNGFVLKENTADELCDKLSEIVTDDSLYARLKEGAAKESENRWSANWDRVLGGIV